MKMDDLNSKLKLLISEHVANERKRLIEAISKGENINIQYLLTKYLNDRILNETEENNINKVEIKEDRCYARIKSGKQCSRHKYDNYDYCKNHINKKPYGKIDDEIVPQDKSNEQILTPNNSTVEIILEDIIIDGKRYYINRDTRVVYEDQNNTCIKMGILGNNNLIEIQ